MDPITLLVLIVVLGLLFDYTNGFHDAANVVSTVIATRVLRPLTAILMAAVLNTLGATQISRVAETITSGLIDPHGATQLTILCAVVGAIFWNLITWYFGIPSSSSYALVGGLIGAAYVNDGFGIVLWEGVIQKVVVPMILSPFAGFFLAFLVMRLLYLFERHYAEKKAEKLFAHLQVGSAALVALSHGLNDAQKSMGIISLGLFTAGFLHAPIIPLWVILSCALFMGLGTATGGYRIIHTLGFQITKISPVQGFATEMSASCVILAASFLGMPVSSTHMITGSVTGIGAARGWKAVRWATTHKLIVAWLLTLPGSALVSALAFYIVSSF